MTWRASRICLRLDHRARLGRAAGAGHQVQDLPLLGAGRVADLELEHEAIHLRLGQRVSALLLDRILRRQHQEGLLEPEGVLADGDLLFLHRLEQGALHLGRRAVDLIGQHQVGEDRPFARREGARLRVVDLRAHHVGRQHVRRELEAGKPHVQAVGQRLD